MIESLGWGNFEYNLSERRAKDERTKSIESLWKVYGKSIEMTFSF